MSGEIQRLVVLGSTVTALAIVRNCHQMGLPVFVVDTRCDPATLSRFPDVEVLDQDDDAAILATLARIATDGQSALIADSDRWLRWLLTHRETLAAIFQVILHPSNAVLETCLNKTRFIRWCAENNLPAPRLHDVAEAAELCPSDFPVLVRPELTRHGFGGDLPKAIEIDNVTQLAKLLQDYRECGAVPNICQSLLRPNVRQYSVGVARNELGNTRVFVAEKLRPPAAKCAGGTYVVASPEDKVAGLAIDAVEKLGLHGIAEIEVIKDADTSELFLLEVNARPWVQYALVTSSGFDLLTFVLFPERYDTSSERGQGRKWISFYDDVYVVFSKSEGMLDSDQINFFDYLKSVMTANSYAYMAFSDPRPALVITYRRLLKFVRRGS